MVKKFNIRVNNAILICILTVFATSFVCCSTESDNKVYICTGSKSKRFHRTSDCMGLSRCSGDIERISKDEAIELGRTECRWCY